jgi:uridine kinase
MNIIQIVGGPGSGKSTLTRQLLSDWPGLAGLLRIDCYLRNRQSDDDEGFLLLRGSIDWPLVMAHIDLLLAGGAVTMPVYDWETGKRMPPPHPPDPQQMIPASEWLVIEGLYFLPVSPRPSVRLFVDSPAEVRRERSEAHATNLSQTLGPAYDRVADPVYEQYILPQRKLADHVLDGSLDRKRLADQARRFLASQWSGWG